MSFLKRLFSGKKMSSPLDSKLIQAISDENVDEVRAALGAGASANVRDEYNNTALMKAARMANEEIVELLIAAGADVNATDAPGGSTALMQSAYRENANCTKALMAAGANVNARNAATGMTALEQARYLNKHPVVAALSGLAEREVWEEAHPREVSYETMSKQLIRQHGPLERVVYVSHFPNFEIEFRYQDGTCIYSGPRTGRLDINFLSLGYYGEGPRYARHFLEAAGFILTADEIDSIRPGDTILLEDGKAVVIRSQ